MHLMDIFLNEPEKILYRVGLGIFKLRSKRLKDAGNSLEKIMYCFKKIEIDNAMLPKNLMKIIFDFTFSRNMI